MKTVQFKKLLIQTSHFHKRFVNEMPPEYFAFNYLGDFLLDVAFSCSTGCRYFCSDEKISFSESKFGPNK